MSPNKMSLLKIGAGGSINNNKRSQFTIKNNHQNYIINNDNIDYDL